MTDSSGQHRRTGWVVATVMLALLAAACSSTPSVAEWEDDWRASVAGTPPMDRVLAAEGDELSTLCSRTVGHLRESMARLELAPNADLGHAASTYIDFAEAVFFDCPIPNGEHAGFEAGYAEMERLAAVVDTLLEFDGGE